VAFLCKRISIAVFPWVLLVALTALLHIPGNAIDAVYSLPRRNIWWLFAFIYKDYKIDESRQLLFEIRDELFDKAAYGMISFDDHAYSITRDTLNGLIRFTHNISLTRFIIMTWAWKDFDDEIKDKFIKKMNNALNQVTPEQKEIYQMSLMRAHLVVTLHLVHTSLLFSVLLLPFRFVLFSTRKIQHLKCHYDNNKNFFDSNEGIWKSIDARANFIAHCHF